MKKLHLKFPHLWILAFPFALYYFGVFLNFLAVTANRGAMPYICPDFLWDAANIQGVTIYAHQFTDMVHRIMIPSDHLKFICDWIQIPGVGIASPGDCFLWLGDWLETPCIASFLTLLYCEYNKFSAT